MSDNKIRLDYIALRMRNVLYYAILFISPLFFGFILKTNNAFELNKIVIFYIFTLLLIILYLPNIINKPFLKNILVFDNKEKVIIIGLLISFIVPSFFSIDLGLSFSGLYERQQGMENLLFLVLFFLLSRFFLRSENRINTAIKFLVSAATIVAVYAILQSLGIDFFSWSEPTKIRTISTFGQPNNMASFLLMVFPLLVYLIVKKDKLKIIWLLIALLLVLAILISYSLASWLSFIFLLVGGLVAFLFVKKSKNLAFIIIFSFLILSLLATFVYFKYPDNKLVKRIRWRIENLSSLETGSTAVRINFYSAALKAIKEKPLFGYGPETQREVLVKYYESDWGKYSNVNVRPSRAHNIILDILLTRGYAGLGMVLIFVLLFLLKLIQKYQQDKNPLYLVILLSSLSYFLYLQFNFHHLSTLIILVFFMAIAFSKLENNPDDVSDELRDEAQGQYFGLFNKTNIRRFYYTIMIVSSLLLGYELLGRMQIDHYYYQVRSSSMYNQYFSVIDLTEEMSGRSQFNNYYQEEVVKVIGNMMIGYTDTRFKKYGKELLLKLIDMDCKNFSCFYARAVGYTALSGFEESYIETAKIDLGKLLEISPQYPATHYYSGVLNLIAGENNEAINNFEHALNLIPDPRDTTINNMQQKQIISERNKIYLYMIEAYKNMNMPELADEYQSKLVEI